MSDTRARAWLCWSSGKDSAWSLHRLREAGDVEVAGLLTTVTSEFERVAMHGVRRTILDAQAEAAGLPLHVVEIPSPCTNEQYGAAMAGAVAAATAEGVTHMAFGDLFLEDVRDYRIAMLADTGLTPIFPVWGEDTARLSRAIVAAGVETYVTCLDPQQLDPSFAGRRYDDAFLDDLPDAVDPCGENGEFHTCVVAGPMFERRIPVEPGEVVERDGFVFADLVPA